MDRDYSHYELVQEMGRGITVYRHKQEYAIPRDQFFGRLSAAYCRLFDTLTPENKLKVFDRDGCVALIDGEWVEVDRAYYLKALGLSE